MILVTILTYAIFAVLVWLFWKIQIEDKLSAKMTQEEKDNLSYTEGEDGKKTDRSN